jgi:hypothetical protein
MTSSGQTVRRRPTSPGRRRSIPRAADYRMRAGDLADERVSFTALQYRRALAVQRGDFRVARVYELIVEHRLREAAK